jgi:hypothetical protein
MRRKNRFDTFKEAPQRGPYDEFPMLELGIDPQVHLSRNAIAQPFFLICEQDTVLAQAAGEARVEFRNSSVNYFNMELGDYVYVPGGTPHRIVPKSESIHLRYKAEHPGLEAAAWYSERTGEEISRVTWDCADELPQAAYLRACTAFNGDAKMRTCPTTGAVLPQIDLGPFRWAEIAAEIHEAEESERPRLAAKSNGAVKTAPRRNATTIAPALDERAPLKNNVYLFARVATTALNPLFPYTEPGSIVPCVTLQDPASRGPMGYFVHFNTVQEVNISFGTRDGYQIPGGCGVGPFRHGVGQKAGQTNPSLINLAVITQRQAVGEPQRESLSFVCEQCDNVLLEREYDAHAFPEELEDEADRPLIGLPTTSQDAVACEGFNGEESMRTCKKCGHVNPAFPADYWGWTEYKRRTHVVALARRIMRDAAKGAAV